MIRHAKQRDVNERAIIEALEARGASVAQIDTTGMPDLLVESRGVLYLLEVKRVKEGKTMALKGKHTDPDPRYRELTASQVKWWRRWRGKAPAIVHDVAEALRAVGLS
jgi:hypothetical protein